MGSDLLNIGLKRMAALCVALALCACAKPLEAPKPDWLEGAKPVYDYPITNPYAATIIAVPAEMRIKEEGVPPTQERQLRVFANRAVPEGLWYQKNLRYGVVLQTYAAPVAYVVAGTGADWRAGNMRLLAQILYLSGFHVVLLPSPTHPNFIVSASGNFTPGRPRQGAEDLYKVMGLIDAELAREVSITGHVLTGYSLGSLDAAFTARLDAERHALNFQRVLLINPPLDLAASMARIDQMLYRGLPNGVDGLDAFIDGALARLAAVSTGGDALDFNNEHLLLDAYKIFRPGDDKLATTIGLSFRFAAANMIMTSDVMSHAGYIFPKNRAFTTSTPLNEALSVALRTSFTNYFEEVYSERYLAEHPGLTKESLLAEGQLEILAPFFARNPQIGLIENRDDLILGAGDAERLAAMFGDRAVVFPSGGHMGNLAHPAVARAIADFMRGVR